MSSLTRILQSPKLRIGWPTILLHKPKLNKNLIKEEYRYIDRNPQMYIFDVY